MDLKQFSFNKVFVRFSSFRVGCEVRYFLELRQKALVLLLQRFHVAAKGLLLANEDWSVLKSVQLKTGQTILVLFKEVFCLDDSVLSSLI